MSHSSSTVLLRLVFLVHLLISVAALDITYPKIGTVYSALGPDDVQWQSNDEEDPSDLAIYLATYSGQNITGQQLCIVSVISDGSTAITLSHPAPSGDSWTWMFYDNDVQIDLGYNYVAESVHFQIQPPKSDSISLSPAIAAAIGVGATVVVVAVILLIGYFFCYKRRQRQKKRETISAAPYTPGHPYSKHELDSKPGTMLSSSLQKEQSHFTPAATKMPLQHEMEVFPDPVSAVSSPSIASPGGELAVIARHSRLTPRSAGPQAAPWREPTVRHEMHHDPNRVLPQELPGDFELGAARNKECY